MPGGRGIHFLLKIPGGGGRGVSGGAEGPGGCLRRIGEFGGGAKFIFLGGPKRPPRMLLHTYSTRWNFQRTQSSS